MNDKLRSISASFLRVALTRLTTAFMMFYVAIFFQPTDLAVAALIILFFNLNELLFENGTYEVYVRNYSVSKRINLSFIKYFVFILSFFVVLVIIFLFNDFFYFLLFILIFLMGFNVNFLSYLKYRQKLPLITKMYVKVNIVMLVFFFGLQSLISDYRLIVLSLLIQQVLLFIILRRYHHFSFIKIKSIDIPIFLTHAKELLIPITFKISAFFSSKIIELFLVFSFGTVILSNYVAGSRIYNIFLLFLFAIINEVFLKRYNKYLLDDSLGDRLILDIYKFGLFICPIFILCFINAEFIINLLFSDKYIYAAKVLSVFSIFGFFQILYVLIYQISLLKIRIVHSIKFNLLSITSVVISFVIAMLLELKFIDFLIFFISVQVFFNFGFLIWFSLKFELDKIIKHLFIVVFINFIYAFFGGFIKAESDLINVVLSFVIICCTSLVLFKVFQCKLKIGVNSENC